MRIWTLAVCSAVVVLLDLPVKPRPLAGAPANDPVRLAVADRVNAFPSIAAAGDFVAVAWGATPPGGSADVFLATSRDGGRTFTAPVRVNHTVGEARLGGELPPRVALAASATGDPAVIVSWGAKAGTTALRVARSTDGGRSFPEATSLPSGDVAGDRGWHNLVIDRRGTAHVLWLDHRRMAARPKPTEHDHHKDGAGMAQWSDLRYATVNARGVEQSERALLPGVCYCCKTALVTGQDGQLFAAWRHVYPGNIRDIAFSQSLDGGRTFSAQTRVSEDQWQLAGCPDDGPAVAVDARGTIHIVWPTVIGGAEPTGALFHATTRDGRTFSPRRRVPTLGSPKPSHPQITIGRNGRIVIAWDEVMDGVRRAARLDATATGATELEFGTPQRLTEGSSAYPMLVTTSTGLLAAWTDGTGVGAAIAVRPLP